MKLTLALGLQYDNSSPSSFASMPLRQMNSLNTVAQPEPVIDADLIPATSSLLEFSNHHGVFFLTYNLQGSPIPVTNDAVKIDMFA